MKILRKKSCSAIAVLLLLMLAFPALTQQKIDDSQLLSLNARAQNAYERGSYNEAEKLWNEALAVSISIYGEKHFSTSACYSNLALTLNNKAEYDRAIEMYNKAAEIDAQITSGTDTANALRFNNIGGVFEDKGMYAEAIDYYTKALNILIKVNESRSGMIHPYTAGCYNNFGSVYEKTGDYERSITSLRKALDIKLKLHGDKSPNTAISYNNLGNPYRSRGDYQKALEYYNMALKIRLDSFGEKHPNTATSYSCIGQTLYAQKKYDEAISYYEKTISIRTEVLGANHPDTALAYNDLGTVYNSKKDHAKAISNYNKALSILERAYNKRHPYIGTVFNNLAAAYQDQKNYDTALRYYNQSLSMRLSFLGEKHPDVAQIYNNMGTLYKVRGNNANAVTNFEKAVDIIKKTEANQRTILYSQNLGKAYFDDKNYVQAYRAFQTGTDTIIKIYEGNATTAKDFAERNADALYYAGSAAMINKYSGSAFTITEILNAKSANTIVMSELQERCADNELVITYLLPENADDYKRPFALIIGQKSSVFVELKTSYKFQVQVEQFIKAPEGSQTKNKLAAELYQELIVPIEKSFTQGKISRLVFIPGKTLESIDIGTLRSPKGVMLLEDFEVRSFSSASAAYGSRK